MEDKILDTVEAGDNPSASHDFPPPTTSPPIKRNKDGECANEGKGCKGIAANKDGPPHWTGYVEAFCAIILILITGAYTYYASQQTAANITAAKAAKDAAETAKETLLVTQRAYLSSGEPEEVLGGWAVIRVPIDNEGNVAATKASLRINFERMTFEGKVLEDRVMDVPLPEEIPSGKRSAFLVISMPNMGPDIKSAVSSGQQHLLVRGHLRYDSGFDRFRTYELVLDYKPNDKGWVNSSGTSIDIWLDDGTRRDVSKSPKH